MVDLDMDRLSEQDVRSSAQMLPGQFPCFAERLPFVFFVLICSWTARLGIEQDAGAVTAHLCDRPWGQSEYAHAANLGGARAKAFQRGR